MITINDEKRGIKILMGESQAQPGATNVTIFAMDEHDIQNAIFDLGENYPNVVFTHPARCADKGWGAMGRVW